jgi:hypothetical protein
MSLGRDRGSSASPGEEAAVDGSADSRDGRALAGGVALLLALTPVVAAGSLAMPMAGVAALAGEPAPPAAEARLCTASGEEILANNVIRRAVYQEQFSHYSRRTGRCYVEMRVEIMDSDEDGDRVGRFLYDGQTKELLAFAEIKNGKKSGRVFDLNHRNTTFENGGWDDASDYIYRMMADDR